MDKWLWQSEGGPAIEDMSHDGQVNFLDFTILAENWLKESD